MCKEKNIKNIPLERLKFMNDESLGLTSGKKYNLNDLEIIIKNCSIRLKTILETQILSPELCVKYILNEDYQILDGDTNICDEMILKYQPHITQDQLISYWKKNN